MVLYDSSRNPNQDSIWEWTWTSDPSASTFSVLRLQMYTTKSCLCSPRCESQGFVHTKQLISLSWSQTHHFDIWSLLFHRYKRLWKETSVYIDQHQYFYQKHQGILLAGNVFKSLHRFAHLLLPTTIFFVWNHCINFKRIYLFLLYEFECLPACICTMCMQYLRKPVELSDTLDLELYLVDSCHVGSEKRN